VEPSGSPRKLKRVPPEKAVCHGKHQTSLILGRPKRSGWPGWQNWTHRKSQVMQESEIPLERSSAAHSCIQLRGGAKISARETAGMVDTWTSGPFFPRFATRSDNWMGQSELMLNAGCRCGL
jgi:hypothetical protein